jgi:hypothetical protein
MSSEAIRAVLILQEFSLSAPPFRYSGEWEPSEGTSYKTHWHDLAQALAWARARAPRVVLHLCVGTGWGERASFSAGETRLSDLAAWNDSTAAAASAVIREPDYGGWASVHEEPYDFAPLETFRLVEETQIVGGDRSIVRTTVEQGLTLRAALEISRSRCAVVVIGTGWPGNYTYYNAGIERYVPDPYPPFVL